MGGGWNKTGGSSIVCKMKSMFPFQKAEKGKRNLPMQKEFL
jgi:hypothetical protein